MSKKIEGWMFHRPKLAQVYNHKPPCLAHLVQIGDTFGIGLKLGKFNTPLIFGPFFLLIWQLLGSFFIVRLLVPKKSMPHR